jgi:hypothetical protein
MMVNVTLTASAAQQTAIAENVMKSPKTGASLLGPKSNAISTKHNTTGPAVNAATMT